MKKFEAVILAGGLGTRLRPVLADRPKALAPIAGRPFLHLLLDRLQANNFGRVILAVGYLADQIELAITRSWKGMEIAYSGEDQPLGTGGALAKAMSLVRNDFVFAMNGDTIVDADYRAAAELFSLQGRVVMYGAFADDCSRYGRLRLNGREVVGMEEKGCLGSGWINAGLYLLPANIFPEADMPEKFSFEQDFLPRFFLTQRAAFLKTEGSFHDIGTPESWNELSSLMAKKTATASCLDQQKNSGTEDVST